MIVVFKQAVVYLHDMKNFARLLGSFGSIPTVHEVQTTYEQAYIFPAHRFDTDDHFEACERIFHTLNLYHPNDYNRRSLSVGDVVCIQEEGYDHYYMVDNLGFKPLNPVFGSSDTDVV